MVARAEQSTRRDAGARGRRLLLATTLLASVALFAIPPGLTSAASKDRSLKLYNVHNGERAVITYMRDGRLDPAGVKQMNRFLRDWRRDEATKMDPRLFDVIWEAYQESGSDDYIHIISAYRSPTTNEMLRSRSRGVAKNSQHTRGRAMDFFLPDVPLSKLREIGLRMQAGGVGFYPTSGSPFVHLDVGSVRHWPRMTRQQLARVFPNGQTLHVPSDGKPLPGYDQALAAYKSRQSAGQLAVASLAPSVEEDDAEETASSAPIVVAGGPGIIPGIDTVLPRRRPGSEPLPPTVAADIADLPATAAEPAASAVEPVVMAFADVPLPRPAPVTTRAQLDDPLAIAAAPAELVAAEVPVDTPASFEERPLVVADATLGIPVPRPAPVTTRSFITEADAPPVIEPASAPRPAVIVAARDTGMSGTVNMAEARARAIAAIRAQLLRKESPPQPDPIGAAVMAFAASASPALRTVPAPDLTMITGSVPLPRARPDAPQPIEMAVLPQQPAAPAVDAFAAPTLATGSPVEIASLMRPGSTRQSHFAVLTTQRADEMPALLLKPNRAIAITFSGFVYDGLRTDRFAGRAVAPLTMVNLNRADGYYVTAQR